ncbi:MAG TPA: citramalate synthase [Gaiellaceae bacterium]|nr:citramalate synthase [Gaiellaceae bacterium]
MSDRVTIYDTTLRDGCQGTGISLSLHDKLSIARKLDEFGVDYIEGGWPGANPKDSQFFVAVREEGLRHARVSAFGSTRHAGIHAEDDAGLQTLLAAETPTVALVAKAWDFHVDAVLKTTLDENLAMVSDSVAFLKSNGREVVVDAEHFFDGYRSNRDYALAVLQAAADAGANWLVLCDTNGGSLPSEVAEAVAHAVATFGDRIGIHAHNDCELAVAISLTAVRAGARQVQGTINGYGERTGNANLSSIVPILALKFGVEVAAREHLDQLTQLSRYVDDVANVESNVRLPFVGDAAFAHKGGIHVHAIAADPRTYEHLDPALVGNRRHIVISEQSGRSNVIARAAELGVEVDPSSSAAKAVVARIKELEEQGFQFEDAEASFELLVRRAADDYHPPFAALAYAVDSRKGRDDDGSTSVATAEVGVGDEVLRGEATGLGPVNALEQAFRRALVPAYPHLANVSLTDFRSSIARNREGRRGQIRVRITGTAPGAERWTTVGSSSDLLHSSWLALIDCLEFAIVTRAGIAPGHPELLPDAGIPVAELAAILQPELRDDDREALDVVAATDWTRTKRDLADPADRAFAAHATALGVALFYNFGNFCAIAAHPRWDSVKRVNLLKGRPENQVGSLTTTRDRFDRVFDWTLLPAGLDRARVLALMDDFYGLGPMGFRGPAAHHVPGHLTSLDDELRTTQIIGPGYRCASNELVEEILARTGEDFLFITSANVSGGVTGKVEAAHYDLRGMQDDFGGSDGIVLIGHRDEGAARASYSHHLPMSTSILAFHKLALDEEGRPALILERHGSLGVDDVRAVAGRHEFALVLGEKAHERLPLRDDVVLQA